MTHFWHAASDQHLITEIITESVDNQYRCIVVLDSGLTREAVADNAQAAEREALDGLDVPWDRIFFPSSYPQV